MIHHGWSELEAEMSDNRAVRIKLSAMFPEDAFNYANLVVKADPRARKAPLPVADQKQQLPPPGTPVTSTSSLSTGTPPAEFAVAADPTRADAPPSRMWKRPRRKLDALADDAAAPSQKAKKCTAEPAAPDAIVEIYR